MIQLRTRYITETLIAARYWYFLLYSSRLSTCWLSGCCGFWAAARASSSYKTDVSNLYKQFLLFFNIL